MYELQYEITKDHLIIRLMRNEEEGPVLESEIRIPLKSEPKKRRK